MSATTPTYAPARAGAAYVVRRLGVERTHTAIWPGPLMVGGFIGPLFWAIPTPVITRCGAVLNDSGKCVVVMREGATVGCLTCRRLSGVEAAA